MNKSMCTNIQSKKYLWCHKIIKITAKKVVQQTRSIALIKFISSESLPAMRRTWALIVKQICRRGSVWLPSIELLGVTEANKEPSCPHHLPSWRRSNEGWSPQWGESPTSDHVSCQMVKGCQCGCVFRGVLRRARRATRATTLRRKQEK